MTPMAHYSFVLVSTTEKVVVGGEAITTLITFVEMFTI